MNDLSARSVHSLQSSSPLDTLVRRTSSRRVKRAPNAIQVSDESRPNFSNPFDEPVPQPRRRAPRPPSSPLLHTQFRSSTGTHSSFNTTLDTFNLSHSRDDSQDVFYDEDANTPSYGRYGRSDGPTYNNDVGQDYTAFPTTTRSRQSSEVDPFMFRQSDPDPMPTIVPQVVISAEAPDIDYEHEYASSHRSPVPAPRSPGYPSPVTPSGRTPSALPQGVNYSRPNRPSVIGSEDEKRKVLERNAHRKISPSSPANSQLWSPSPSAVSSPRSRSTEPGQDPRSSGRSPAPHSPYAMPRSPNETQYTASVSSLALPSPSPSLSRSRSESVMQPSSAAASSGFVSLRREPPPIPSSPATSVYSSYSFYQLDNPNGSNDTLQVPGALPSP
ncbi:hypothetical protein OF83DRAFT_655894 [Amylostereum chailletii]|nr:hypothetical protein OF83DRAFT_655894 [Amylostereum chailletii]